MGRHSPLTHGLIGRPRILATSADEAGDALLPQLVRIKFTTSATSLSESRQAKRGMVNCAGVPAVRGLCDPSSTMEMSERGFAACTTGLPARRGNTCSYPMPSGRWHAARFTYDTLEHTLLKNGDASKPGVC